MTPEQIARMRLLAHSSFCDDLLGFLADYRAQASNDLESAVEPPRIYRAQGSITAFDLLANELHRLRTAPPEMADKQIQLEE